MSTELRIRIEGLAEAERRLGPGLIARPLRRFFDRATIAIQSEARERAPVDTGRLRGDIMREIDPALVPRWGRVGTDVGYAIFVHEGTRPHWPPLAPIARWAARHGADPDVVRRGIARRGTRPRPFLRDGLRASLPAIQRAAELIAPEIEAEAER